MEREDWFTSTDWLLNGKKWLNKPELKGTRAALKSANLSQRRTLTYKSESQMMGCIFGEGRFLENHEDDSLDVEGNQ